MCAEGLGVSGLGSCNVDARNASASCFITSFLSPARIPILCEHSDNPSPKEEGAARNGAQWGLPGLEDDLASWRDLNTGAS